MLHKLTKEYHFFLSHPRGMRVLLLTNLLYNLVVPIVELFVGAYIIRNSADFSLVMVFQLAQAAGIPLGFMCNGFLLTRVAVPRLYSLGMLLSSLSMGFMMTLNELDMAGTSVAGFLMGLSVGFFWANRTYLTLSSTSNENRNYYYGLETFFSTLAFILMPFLAGLFLGTARRLEWFGGNVNGAYYVLTGWVFIVTIGASLLIHQGQFRNPRKAPFLYSRFHRLWRKMLGLSVFKGTAQGYIIAAPVMLILRLVGEEGALGAIQSSGAILTAVLLYLLGRRTNPSHRTAIYATGLSLFLLGSLANMALYSAAGVIIFVACLVLARPLLDLAYFPIQLGTIEFVAAREKRNAFTYIFTHEIGLFTGRVVGCGLFILLARFAGEDVALRYALLVIAGVYFLSLFVARSIVNDKAWHEPVEDDLTAVDALKRPVEL